MHSDEDAARRRLARRLEELMSRHGYSRQSLADATGFKRPQVSGAIAGRIVPSPNLIKALDRELRAGGELISLWKDAKLEELRKELDTELPGPRARRGVETDRREVVELGALAVAAGLAGEVSRRIAGGDPDPLTLDELDERLDQIGAAYTTTPHAVLTPLIVGGWRDVERLLDGRLSSRVRGRLTLVAGLYAFYGGRLAFNVGDDAAARRFASLAELYARDVGDPLLTGSVATLQTSIAYYTGRHTAAADIAAQARIGAHPYLRARLAAYEARARAAAGQHDQARQALRDMQDAVWLGEPQPGTEPFGEELTHTFVAVVSGRLGDGETAEPHARRALTILEAAGGGYEDIGGTYNALAQALLRRSQPDPEQAADAASRALAALEGRPTRTVIQRSGQIWQELGARWEGQRAVVELGERLQAHRRALPAGSSA
ncbi:DNA-binding protein [Parafrankia soli]|uniref:DNA-binding protein n=1 Tax=Parafrankia soli TaxID=2599596 RepID=A0A1S1PE47_9ACTN|nr:helix-turn-helix domain-containing protein [Parafrankia soli]OHV21198.1 DNA-binding protein [Parafrankia soli]